MREAPTDEMRFAPNYPKQHTDDECVVCKNAEEIFYGSRGECELILDALAECAGYFVTYFLYTRAELNAIKNREPDHSWDDYCEWKHGDTYEMGEL